MTSGGSGGNSSPNLSQWELLDTMGAEIETQVWQFEPEVVARMLSPKTRTQSLPSHVSHYKCAISDHANTLESASATFSSEYAKLGPYPDTELEMGFYPYIAAFLNACVYSCNTALSCLPDPTLSTRWNRDLNFMVYDLPTKDVAGAYPLKPGQAEGRALRGGGRNPPDTTKKDNLELPVGIESSPQALTEQCATYARDLLLAAPSRVFALVLAFDQNRGELSFFLFHRGGLTRSKPLDIRVEDNHREILRLFLSILLWKTPKDAGFVASCNEREYALPFNDTDAERIVATVDSVRGRATRVNRLSLQPAVQSEDELILASAWSSILASPSSVTVPEHRSYIITPGELEGRPLTAARSSRELRDAIVYSMLGGALLICSPVFAD